jgi:hypothetical protein
LKTDDSCIILNPIIISSSLLNEEYNISIFKNGKRDLSLKIEPQILKEIVLLDFYPIIDKIFYDFKQFDAVIDKTNIIVSFKLIGG